MEQALQIVIEALQYPTLIIRSELNKRACKSHSFHQKKRPSQNCMKKFQTLLLNQASKQPIACDFILLNNRQKLEKGAMAFSGLDKRQRSPVLSALRSYN